MIPVWSLEVCVPISRYLISERGLIKKISTLDPFVQIFLSVGGAAVPMVEAMVALVLIDQLMAHLAQCEMFPVNPTLQQPVSPPSDGSLLMPELA